MHFSRVGFSNFLPIREVKREFSSAWVSPFFASYGGKTTFSHREGLSRSSQLDK
jgi:hypothetical protein